MNTNESLNLSKQKIGIHATDLYDKNTYKQQQEDQRYKANKKQFSNYFSIPVSQEPKGVESTTIDTKILSTSLPPIKMQ